MLHPKAKESGKQINHEINIIFDNTKPQIPDTKIPSVKNNIFVMKIAICAPTIPKMQISFSISIVRKNKKPNTNKQNPKTPMTYV